MTKLEEMAKAGWEQTQLQVPEAYRLMDWGLVPADAKQRFVEFMVAGLKVLREPSEAMLRAGTHDTNAFERMIDAVLAEAPK